MGTPCLLCQTLHPSLNLCVCACEYVCVCASTRSIFVCIFIVLLFFTPAPPKYPPVRSVPLPAAPVRGFLSCVPFVCLAHPPSDRPRPHRHSAQTSLLAAFLLARALTQTVACASLRQQGSRAHADPSVRRPVVAHLCTLGMRQKRKARGVPRGSFCLSTPCFFLPSHGLPPPEGVTSRAGGPFSGRSFWNPFFLHLLLSFPSPCAFVRSAFHLLFVVLYACACVFVCMAEWSRLCGVWGKTGELLSLKSPIVTPRTEKPRFGRLLGLVLGSWYLRRVLGVHKTPHPYSLASALRVGGVQRGNRI
eukprot:RCo043870